ncbi:MAG: tandem-95 repeat protein, partial [Candidatus Paceibacterota bacterium]
CTNVGNLVTMTAGTGTCTVHYNQVGNGTYLAATEVTESTTATPKSLTPSVTADDKTFDGNNTATISNCSLAGIVNSDAVTCSATSATFADSVVGTGKTVTATGITLGGVAASKYQLSSTSAVDTADITAAPNSAPVATAQSVTADEDVAKAIVLTGTDVDLDTLTFATTSNPAHGTLSGFNASTGEVTYTSDIDYNGTDSFDFVVNDGEFDSVTATVTITVSAVNDVPSFAVSSSTISVDEDASAFSLSNWATAIFAGATDEASQLLTFIVGVDVPALFSVLPSIATDGTLTFTLATNANGLATLTAKIFDNGGGTNTSASSTFNISVNAVNDAPVLNAIGDKSVNENTLLSFGISGSDVDLDTLTYFASNLPSGATFNAGTQVFSWTPTYSDAGTYSTVHFEVFDGTATTSEDITITVDNVNQVPVLTTIGNQIVDEDSTLAFIVSATDADLDTLTYTVANLPSGATFSTSTGEFSWTPLYSQAGNYSVTFGAGDGFATTTEIVPIDVGDVNTTPNLGLIGNKSGDEMTAINFTVSATDLDGDTVTYELSGDVATTTATFDTNTGDFSWTPTEAEGPAVYTATITATDGTSTDSETFMITVSEVNLAPVTPNLTLTVDEDTTGTTTLSATDTDFPSQAGAIFYSIVTQPTHGSAVLAGDEVVYTPDLNWNGTDVYEYVANDGVTVGATSTVTVTVDPVNDIPTISLIGGSSLTLVQYSTSTDPGVTGTDVEDGDISASVTTDNAYSSLSSGSYGITYTVTDLDGATASVMRTITVDPSGTNGSGSSGIVGCRDSSATNFNVNATHDGVTCTYGQVLGVSTSTEPITGTSTTPIITGTTTPTGEVLGVTVYNFTRNLGFGSRGDDVTELQKMLIAGGFLTLDTPTKYFGALTRAALRGWQTKNGISSTGYFGVLSRAFLAK